MLSVSKTGSRIPLNLGAGCRTAKAQASSLEIQDQLETSKARHLTRAKAEAGILFTSPDASRSGRADWCGTSPPSLWPCSSRVRQWRNSNDYVQGRKVAVLF
jgi:hypothetical protein